MIEEFRFTHDYYLRGMKDPFSPGNHPIILKTHRDSIDGNLFSRIYVELLVFLPNYKLCIDSNERTIVFIYSFLPTAKLDDKYKQREIQEDWFESTELWHHIRNLRLKRPDHIEALKKFATGHPFFLRKFKGILEHKKFEEVLEYKMGWYEYEQAVLRQRDEEHEKFQKILDGILSSKN